MNKNRKIAEKLLAKAKEFDWAIFVQGEILQIIKFFIPENLEQYRKADGEWYWILNLLPRSRPGSDWGTDGSGVGGYHALKHGVFTMNRSGGNLFVLRELTKLLQENKDG
jgi:hypothetical protein